MSYTKTTWVDDDGSYLVGTRFTAARGNNIEQGIADAHSGVAIPFVTTLPASPVDGQQVFFVADANNGVVWQLKYRAADPSAYKWQYVGGAGLRNVVSTGNSDETTTSTTYTNLPTAGPSITVPLAGDYDMEFDVESFRNDGGAGTDAYIAFQHGASAAATAERISNGSGQLVPGSAHRRWTSLVASDVIQAKYAVSGGTGRFRGQRTMKVTPVRVG